MRGFSYTFLIQKRASLKAMPFFSYYLLFFFFDPLRELCIFMLSSYSRSSRLCCAFARPSVHMTYISAAPMKMNIA